MKCPKCQSGKLKTVNSRTTKSGSQTWRRKQCPKCNETITTYEKPQLDWLTIKDPLVSTEVPYNRFLLTISILEAFGGKNTSDPQIEALIETVEMKLINLKAQIVSKSEVVIITAKSLKPVNLNAYMSYVAAHTSPHTQRELTKLIKNL